MTQREQLTWDAMYSDFCYKYTSNGLTSSDYQCTEKGFYSSSYEGADCNEDKLDSRKMYPWDKCIPYQGIWVILSWIPQIPRIQATNQIHSIQKEELSEVEISRDIAGVAGDVLGQQETSCVGQVSLDSEDVAAVTGEVKSNGRNN